MILMVYISTIIFILMPNTMVVQISLMSKVGMPTKKVGENSHVLIGEEQV